MRRQSRATAAIAAPKPAARTTPRMVRPSGLPLASHGAASDPATWARPVAARASPIVSGSRWCSSARTNSRRVWIPVFPRFVMSWKTTSARRIALRPMNAKPARTSRPTPTAVRGSRSSTRGASTGGSDPHRAGRAEPGDADPGERGARDVRDPLGALVGGVPSGQLRRMDERGDDAEVARQIPDHLARAEEEGHDEDELDEAQRGGHRERVGELEREQGQHDRPELRRRRTDADRPDERGEPRVAERTGQPDMAVPGGSNGVGHSSLMMYHRRRIGEIVRMTAPRTVAIENVTAIPLDGDARLASHTVLVRDDRISWVGPASAAKVPDDAMRIDGRGRFVIPGLADMHAHPRTEDDLLLFLANGVTTVRNMWGTPRHVGWRDWIARGEMLGPALHTAGPLTDGDPTMRVGAESVGTLAEAVEAVGRAARAGYEAIKVYDHHSPESYDALVRAAADRGLPVVGHVPFRVGLARALAASQRSIEHLYGYIEAMQPVGSPLRECLIEPAAARRALAEGATERADHNKIPKLVNATKT